MRTEILLRNGFIELSLNTYSNPNLWIDKSCIGTILANMAYYGYIPSNEVLRIFVNSPTTQLTNFWTNFEPFLKKVTGDDRNMGDYVVYKNFPNEVLEMSQAEYWFNQILMYWGAPNELFTQNEKDREPLKELKTLKVLHLAKPNTLDNIRNNLIQSKTRWTPFELEAAAWLGYSNTNLLQVIGFKENGINLIADAFNRGIRNYVINDATDVLRVIAAICEQDVSLRIPPRFRRFTRRERKYFLQLLENTKNLDEDFNARPEIWKRLISSLHPGDYYKVCPKVCAASDKLYNNSYQSYNRIVDGRNSSRKEVIKAMKGRPGDFLRRFHAAYAKYGAKIVDDFLKVVPSLNTLQLLKMFKYLINVNDRKTFMVAPRGQWNKVKVIENNKVKIDENSLQTLVDGISNVLIDRISNKIDSVDLDERLTKVKLPTNDSENTDYGRGTVIDIPDNINFLRSASFWEYKDYNRNIWYDNGWNFFDENWKLQNTCCWNSTNCLGAVFSGDPTNSKDLDGKACQMIDLYIDQLVSSGIRFAVWNILCFSNKTFASAKEVLATLQMGENAETGKLYEPSRAEVVFPLSGESLTKYIAYVDLVERKIVYMDANFPGDTDSARNNGVTLEKLMPAYVEYLESLPSVWDLFSFTVSNDHGTKILYDDSNVDVSGKAYVYKTVNTDSKFEQISLSEIME